MPTDQRSADEAYELKLPRVTVIGLVKVPDGGTWPDGSPPRGPLDDAHNALKESGSGWQLSVEVGTHPFVIPVVLSYQRPAGVQRFPSLGDLADFLSHLPDPVRLVGEVMLVPTPGHKGQTSGSAPHRRHFTRGDLDRVPVAVIPSKPPPRRSRDQLHGHRRPVVALLDTKVDTHDWLGRPDPKLGGDGFWVDAGSLGWEPGRRLDPPKAVPHQELGEGEGLGTFSAGLIRQVAPDVQVLALHAMPDDEGVYGDHILNALAWLAGDGGPALEEGDVVCLPACFRYQLPTDGTFLDWLGDVLGELARNKVRVVAAAGNDGSDTPVYPAAFAVAKGGPSGGVRHVSVGALNTDGTTPAYFSNYGDWVTEWEVGTSLVSTFPRINRAAAPELVADGRRSADPDDFTGGFARWSGTSFAAAVHAGKLAQRGLEAAIGAAE
jgi:hypothetical protein